MKNFWLDKENSKKLAHILENFDFRKVHNAMVALNWQWYGKGIPSITDMKEMATRLFNDICNSDSSAIGCGGFYVEKYDSEEAGEEVIRLSFRVEEYDTMFYNEE